MPAYWNRKIKRTLKINSYLYTGRLIKIDRAFFFLVKKSRIYCCIFSLNLYGLTFFIKAKIVYGYENIHGEDILHCKIQINRSLLLFILYA